MACNRNTSVLVADGSDLYKEASLTAIGALGVLPVSSAQNIKVGCHPYSREISTIVPKCHTDTFSTNVREKQAKMRFSPFSREGKEKSKY